MESKKKLKQNIGWEGGRKTLKEVRQQNKGDMKGEMGVMGKMIYVTSGMKRNNRKNLGDGQLTLRMPETFIWKPVIL